MFLMSRRNLLSWIFSARILAIISWSKDPKQSEISPSVNQVAPDQTSSIAQRGVAAMAGPETTGPAGELRLVIRFQQEADHFADEFIRPGRQAGRS
jgi:hypothetical protein